MCRSTSRRGISCSSMNERAWSNTASSAPSSPTSASDRNRSYRSAARPSRSSSALERLAEGLVGRRPVPALAADVPERAPRERTAVSVRCDGRCLGPHRRRVVQVADRLGQTRQHPVHREPLAGVEGVQDLAARQPVNPLPRSLGPPATVERVPPRQRRLQRGDGLPVSLGRLERPAVVPHGGWAVAGSPRQVPERDRRLRLVGPSPEPLSPPPRAAEGLFCLPDPPHSLKSERSVVEQGQLGVFVPLVEGNLDRPVVEPQGLFRPIRLPAQLAEVREGDDLAPRVGRPLRQA